MPNKFWSSVPASTLLAAIEAKERYSGTELSMRLSALAAGETYEQFMSRDMTQADVDAVAAMQDMSGFREADDEVVGLDGAVWHFVLDPLAMEYGQFADLETIAETGGPNAMRNTLSVLASDSKETPYSVRERTGPSRVRHVLSSVPADLAYSNLAFFLQGARRSGRGSRRSTRLELTRLTRRADSQALLRSLRSGILALTGSPLRQ